MGGAASSSAVYRLRKALVMRAYNVRGEHEATSLEDQFRPLAYQPAIGGSECIDIRSIKACLHLTDENSGNANSGHWLDALLAAVFPDSVNSEAISFKAFIDFLETGAVPRKRVASVLPRATAAVAAEDERSSVLLTSKSAPHLLRSPKASPSYGSSSSSNNSNNNSYDDQGHVHRKASSKPSTPNGSNSSSSSGVSSITNSNCRDVVVAQPRTVALTGADAYRGPLDTRQKWKKREVVKQERSVYYTTIDETGEMQELVETELHQTETLHMECRDTGEFAHREVTYFEQTETFNNELVNEQHGSEVYVHFKSADDEIEFAESTMPRKEPEEGVDDGPRSPRVGDDRDGYYGSGERERERASSEVPEEVAEQQQQQQHDSIIMQGDLSEGDNTSLAQPEDMLRSRTPSYTFEPTQDGEAAGCSDELDSDDGAEGGSTGAHTSHEDDASGPSLHYQFFSPSHQDKTMSASPVRGFFKTANGLSNDDVMTAAYTNATAAVSLQPSDNDSFDID